MAAAVAALTFSAVAETPRIDSRAYLEHVRFLASDELEGRGNGTPGLEKAAEYVATQFRNASLEPAGVNGTFFQPLQIVTGLSLSSRNSLTVKTAGGASTLQPGRDYRLLSISNVGSSGTTATAAQSAALVFVGYGISAPEFHYDDYAGQDVKGKVVLMLRHEPQENDADSPFDGKASSKHATIMQKAMNARSQGALAVVLVDDPLHSVDTNEFRVWMQDPQAEEYGIPVFHASRDRVEASLGNALNFAAVAEAIDRDLRPKSQVLNGITVTAAEEVTKVRRTVRNVVGILKSDGPRGSEAVVIGAHYDHLGRGGRDSLAESAAGQIHNGADDNASGTAALIEMARAAAKDRGSFGRSLVFVAFAGEELGLFGSAYYTDHPAVPLDRTIAMINLDMVGRPGGRILINGLDSAPSIDADLKAAQAQSSLQVSAFREGAGVGASDDTSFAARRIPSIGFFSGFHSDYHRPSDDWDKIDAVGAAAVADLALALAQRLSMRPDRPEFVAPPPSQHSGTASSGGGYGPYFGSVPDFAEGDNGVKFAEVRDGSPAGKAGLKRGDVLISFDGKAVKTLYDFTFALRDKKPGDEVEVTVLRDGKPINAVVELGNRP